MLTEEIITKDWREYTHPEDIPVIPEGVRVNNGHPLSVFHLDTILNDPREYSQRNTERPFGVPDTAEMILWHVFGVAAGEQDHVLKRGNVFYTYAKRALERLHKGQDTGLVHPDTLEVWEALSGSQKADVSDLLLEASEGLDAFPNMGTMNVVFTNKESTIDLGPTAPSVLVPVVVETRKGMAVIVPSMANNAGFDHRAVAGSLSGIMGGVSGAKISQVHLWDIGLRRVRLAKNDDTRSAVQMISALSS